jgi:hemerythrin-like domain-containing protein
MAKDRKKSPVHEQIEENLRRVYDEALNDQVPDRFMELLRQLKEAETKKPAGKDGDES